MRKAIDERVRNPWLHKACAPTMTGVGFEPEPSRTGAWSQRPRPLDQTVDMNADEKRNNIAMLTRVAHVSHALRAFARKHCIEKIKLNTNKCAVAQMMAFS